MTRTAIVLAGGRSSRFGGDKLAADVDGTSLLAAAIAVNESIADGVIVAGPTLPAGFVGREVPVALVPDAEPFGGPLAALANVLGRAATAHPVDDVAIVVGGDMPRLVPAVLELLLARLAADPSIDAVSLAPATSTPDAAEPPRRQVLPLAIRVAPAARAAARSIEAGDRSLVRFVDRLRSIEVPWAEWLPLDPEAQTLLDVDEPADLARLGQPRERPSR